MKKTIGRPKADNPLSVEVKARIDNETKKSLVEYCEQNNKTVTEVIRDGIKLVIEKK